MSNKPESFGRSLDQTCRYHLLYHNSVREREELDEFTIILAGTSWYALPCTHNTTTLQTATTPTTTTTHNHPLHTYFCFGIFPCIGWRCCCLRPCKDCCR